MANLLITQVAGGIKIVSENSTFIINEFSTKINNNNVNELEIISDIKDNYAEFKINFGHYDNVIYNGITYITANQLQIALSNISQVENYNSGLAISKGIITGTTYIHKFGNAPDFDTSDGFIDVWDGANDAGLNLMQYTYSTIADIDRISSDSASDTFDVEIQGLDTNYDLVIQTITLTGTTPANLTTPLIRVFRMKNVGSVNNVGRIFCFKNVATTGGVPNTPANVRAVIQPGNNQTLMAIYTVPNGYTAYMRDWYASLNNNVSTYLGVQFRARPFGQVFQIKHAQTLNSAGTSSFKFNYVEPEVFKAKTDLTMRVMTGGTSVAASAGFDLVLIAD